jgi:hypothetical protein
MAGCETNKKMYPTEVVAEDALIEAWTAYDYRNATGPVNVYRCDICGAYHLTSKGEMNKRLAEFIRSGTLKKNVEANLWLDKIKKKR